MLQDTAFRPSVDFEPHKKLELEVKEYLESLDFVTFESTYHAVMNASLCRLVQYRFTPTALYIRARADRMAFHLQNKVDFEWECKTHESQMWHDLTIEMLPLAHHIKKSALGVKCLYCYKDPFMHRNCGFWTDNIPNIREIRLPLAKQTADLWDWFEEMAHENFPGVKVIRCPHRNGSGDPYVIIDEREVRKLSHWKLLINNTLQQRPSHEAPPPD